MCLCVQDLVNTIASTLFFFLSSLVLACINHKIGAEIAAVVSSRKEGSDWPAESDTFCGDVSIGQNNFTSLLGLIGCER